MNEKWRYKLTALLLALTLAACAFAAPVCAAVSMPAGVSRAQLDATLPKVEAAAEAVMKMSPETANLSRTVYAALISDKTLNTLFTKVYEALADQQATLKVINVDISPEHLAAVLSEYPEVSAALTGKTEWKQVLDGSFDPKWNVTTRAGFAKAAADMLSPLNELLYVLLCGGTYQVNTLVSIQGANGYENAVVPLFRALDTPNILTQEVFSADAASNRYLMVRDIVRMLFDAIDRIVASPVSSLCQTLPSVADYLVSGKLSEAVKTLVAPLKVRALLGLVQINVDQLLQNADLMSSSDDLTAMLENTDLSDLLGTDVRLDLPKVDLAEMASCGETRNGQFVSDPTAAFVVLLRWIIDAVRLNKSRLPALLGQDLSGAGDILDSFLAKDNDEIIKMLVDLMNLSAGETVLEYQWTYPAYTPGAVTYTANLSRDDFIKVLAGIDGTLDNFLTEFTDKGKLSDLLAQRVYSGETLSQLVVGIYGAMADESAVSAFKLLGVDISPAGVASAISSAYPSAASALRRASSWKNVNAAALSWGFAAGSKEGFANALTAVLMPFRPLLSLLLAEGSFTLLNAVTVRGSNGYNTAVIPLLEALSCSPDAIKSYSEYKQTAGTAAAVTDILNPVFGVLDRLIASPVNTACEILPNLVYFIDGGGLNQCIENLTYPVRVLLGKLGAEDMLGDALSSLSDFNVSSLVTQLTADSDLGITLPEPDLHRLASLGTAVTRESKRTYNGSPCTQVYIEADGPAVMVTVLRYVFNALSLEENKGALGGLTPAADGSEGMDMMATYMTNMEAQLSSMSTDELIEYLYKLLFSETPKREEPAVQAQEIPEIVYEDPGKKSAFPWTAVIVSVVLAALAGAMFLLFRGRPGGRVKRQKATAAVTPASPAPASSGGSGKAQAKYENAVVKQRLAQEKARIKNDRQASKDADRAAASAQARSAPAAQPPVRSAPPTQPPVRFAPSAQPQASAAKTAQAPQTRLAPQAGQAPAAPAPRPKPAEKTKEELKKEKDLIKNKLAEEKARLKSERAKNKR